MKKFKTPENYLFFDNISYHDDVPYQQLYLVLFDNLPSTYFNKVSYDSKVMDFLVEDNFVEEIRVDSSRKEITRLFNRRFDLDLFINTSERIFINYEKEIIIKVLIRREDNGEVISLTIIYNIKKGQISNQIDLKNFMNLDKNKKSSKIHLVKSEMGALDTEEYDLKSQIVNLELNYGKSFLKINDLILKRLNTNNDKGIILLHGDPGTGKTSYIKYLTSQIQEKDVLFIPPSMAETLSEPSIIPFLMDHKNSILIIEDAERVISDREFNGSSAGVSNILNITDGILGDCLNIQIIATFNMKREKIDQALLRKGRLIVEHKFTPLNVEETNNLLKSLKKDYISKEEMCLADIYNIDVEQFKSDNNLNKIGF